MHNCATVLKEARVRAGLFQKNVSDKLGLTTPQFLSNLERGLVTIPPKQMKTLAKILKVKPQVFVDAYVADVTARVKKEAGL